MRQGAQLCTGPADGITGSDIAVVGKVVHRQDLAGLERRRQHLPDEGQEGSAMHRSVEHRGVVIPLSLSAPTKIMIFQCPWGTGT